ncbi:uncharacterized protein BJ212DRAFT_1298955 [Suillus subaureus]|uniref:F-box domain-containing protein n=1 Tax=Suillus subaureus TaxID=48587 RepID=A0A9P7ED09_9AGAM|nr:uncharacterized protein BJ212DRAFT_1298955 [Suillus subaureus]KAG1818115.1 hypothetical protein BJ212DRAFT_1298955 [Suillus subaureus]
MHFLSRRSAEPSRLSSDLDIAGGRNAAADSAVPQEKSPSRVLKRVTTLFNPRKRTLSKNTSPVGGHGAVGFIRDAAATYPRSSSDSSTASPDEIRRPSGLGRRASLMESLQSPSDLERSNENGGLFAEHATHAGVAIQRLPVELLETILSFLPKFDLPRIALVSAQLCDASRNILYRILDFQLISEPQVEKLCRTLATHASLAAKVQSFLCHFWPATTSSDGHLIPSLDLMTALHNMSNLQSLTLRTFVPVFSQSPLLSFRLKTLVILDDTISVEQIIDILHFLRNQSSLQYLAFPNVVENPSLPECSFNQPIFASGLARETMLPSLSQLHAPPRLMMAICSLLGQALQTVVLDVTTTLYTGLRPAVLLRAIQGVSKLDVVFTHEVDKRTVEKFLGAAGGILSGSGAANSRGLTVLEVEVLWMEDDTAEILYGIIDAIISRFNGLRTLKITTPFRSRQSQLLTPPLSGSLQLSTSSNTPTTPSSGLSSMLITSPVGVVLSSEFVSSGTERTHAKMWTKACSTLSDIQFCFPDPSLEADVGLCGVWFHRRE